MQLTNSIKKVFLSFAQQYFRDVHPTLTWNADPRQTEIFIADKFVSSPAVIEKMPAIILSRGPATFIQSSIDQMIAVDAPYGETAKRRTDLVRTSITYNCTSQNGIEAEDIANTLYLNLVGYKDKFRERGIHQIMGISMGEEQIVRGDVVPRLFMVPVNVIFTVQTDIVTSDDLYTCLVTLSGDIKVQTPSVSVIGDIPGYVISGLTLTFDEAPTSGLTLAASYKGKYTLTDYTNVTPAGIVDGTNYIFTLPEEVYTQYLILSGIVAYVTAVSGVSASS